MRAMPTSSRLFRTSVDYLFTDLKADGVLNFSGNCSLKTIYCIASLERDTRGAAV